MTGSAASEHPVAGVDDILITDELTSRPSRPPDHAQESRALGLLAHEMAINPRGVLHKCAELVMELCNADSAGISILEPGGASGVFRWQAAVGGFAGHLNGVMPREASPCGTVMERDCVLLFRNAERCFPELRCVEPPIYENLLVPWHAKGEPVGTLWAIKHTAEGRFDAEDGRILQSLARFAAAAFQMIATLEEVTAERSALRAGEEKYRKLFNSIDEAYAVVDVLKDDAGRWHDFRFVEVNPAFIKHTGMPDPVGQTATQLLGKANPRWAELYGQALDTGQPLRVEEGEPTLGKLFDLNIFALDRETNRVAILFTDITVRKQTEAVLRQSEERQSFLLWLSDAMRAEPDADAIAMLALKTLSARLKLDRCYIAEYRLEDDWADFTHQFMEEGLDPLPSGIRLSDFPEALQIAMGDTLVIDDVGSADFLSDVDKRNMQALGMGALVAAAARRGENLPLWTIVAVSTGARAWAASEVALIEEVNERTWAAMARARVEEALRGSEERLALAVDIGELAAWDWDLSTGAVTWNERHYLMEGYVPGEVTPSFEAWAARLHPEDRDDTIASIERARDCREPYVHDFRTQWPDGTVRWCSARGQFYYGPDGKPLRMIGLMEDVTERKLSEAALFEGQQRQQVLVAELQHRTRNLMTVVGSLMRQTADECTSLDEFERQFSHRLAALSRVQSLLSQLSRGERLSFADLLRSELMALGAPAEKLTLGGPENIPLRSATVQTFALALHELTTNAVKHGAFAAPGGRLAVHWSADTDPNGARTLMVDWRESGLALAACGGLGASSGYGRELIEHALPYQLGAQTTYELTPDGVHCTITVPL